MVRVLLLALLFAGCSRQSPAETAEKQLAFLRQNGGSREDICAAARKVQNAYGDAMNAEKYKSAKLFADIDCRLAGDP